MTVRPPAGFQLPDIVLVGNRVLNEEAEALRSAMVYFGAAPQLGSPWVQDDEAFGDRAKLFVPGRATILQHARHQAALIYVNAWDHLISLARLLGGDGAMALFTQASVSRVICEAAVRFAWLMDPQVSSAERLVRGAVALHNSAEERSKGVNALPAGYVHSHLHEGMLASAQKERELITNLIAGAGMTYSYLTSTNRKIRLELQSISVPLKINISQLMAKWLPDSPSWYNIGSSVTHSIYWGLRDLNHSRPGQSLALTPNVLDVGAAIESAISGSALILDRCGRMNGHDATSHVQHSQQRRGEVDALMRRAATSTWVHIPSESPPGRQP